MSVHRVTRERWQQAQQAELAYWERAEERKKRGWRRVVWPVARPFLKAIGSRRVTGDDWNLWWQAQFDEYSFLPRELGDYIELGCGPYTNTRLILRGRTAKRVICSDPLIMEYLQFRERWLAQAYRKGVVEVDDHPIEELPFRPDSFDVVVMINVLEHVRDADACMTAATRLVRAGGYFIFGNQLCRAGCVPDEDVLHPIRTGSADLLPHLAPFHPVHLKVTRHIDARPGFESTFIFAGLRDLPDRPHGM